MPWPDFEDLPFEERPDLTPYLVHLTKNTKASDKFSALDNLINILKTGEIWGCSTSKGFIKGPTEAEVHILRHLHHQEDGVQKRLPAGALSVRR
jgi:hypothetical protein